MAHSQSNFIRIFMNRIFRRLIRSNSFFYLQNSFGRPDDIVAAETLANHVRCNNSFVHAVFQAQFRSSLTCPRCHRQSNTFDPFLCVSVPVPQNHRQMNLYVNVLYTSQQPRQVKIGVSVNQAANVRELREILASDTGVDENHMLLTEIHDEGFHRLNYDLKKLLNIVMKGEQLISAKNKFHSYIVKKARRNETRRYEHKTWQIFSFYRDLLSVCIVY